MKIGISFSGGGARGIAHLGVLQALHELDIRPSKMLGISSGAIAAAFYAEGHTGKETLGYIKKSRFLWSLRPSLNRPGLLNMERLRKLYLKYIPHNSFEKLKIPLVIGATDVNAGKMLFFSDGELIKPILGSCAIPLIFCPVSYQDKTLVDGGITNNLPIAPLEDCDVIIGVHCNPYNPEIPLKSTRSVLERSLLVMVQQNVKNNLTKCHLVIEPPDLVNFSASNLSKTDEIYKIGYEYTLSLASQLNDLMLREKTSHEK